jgi:hypothetical protein
METMTIISPTPGALVRWREVVFVQTTPVKVPFMLYVVQEDDLWHRQPVPIFRGALTGTHTGLWEARCYFGLDQPRMGQHYAIAAVLSHDELPHQMESLPESRQQAQHSPIVQVIRR